MIVYITADQYIVWSCPTVGSRYLNCMIVEGIVLCTGSSDCSWLMEYMDLHREWGFFKNDSVDSYCRSKSDLNETSDG